MAQDEQMYVRVGMIVCFNQPDKFVVVMIRNCCDVENSTQILILTNPPEAETRQHPAEYGQEHDTKAQEIGGGGGSSSSEGGARAASTTQEEPTESRGMQSEWDPAQRKAELAMLRHLSEQDATEHERAQLKSESEEFAAQGT